MNFSFWLCASFEASILWQLQIDSLRTTLIYPRILHNDQCSENEVVLRHSFVGRAATGCLNIERSETKTKEKTTLIAFLTRSRTSRYNLLKYILESLEHTNDGLKLLFLKSTGPTSLPNGWELAAVMSLRVKFKRPPGQCNYLSK